MSWKVQVVSWNASLRLKPQEYSTQLLWESYVHWTEFRAEISAHFHDNVIKRFTVQVPVRQPLKYVTTKGCLVPFKFWWRTIAAPWSVTIAKQRIFCNHNRSLHCFCEWCSLSLLVKWPIKSQLQQVNRSTMFPQVLISPEEAHNWRRRQTSMEGIFIRWWVVNQLLLEAKEFHLPPNHTTQSPSQATCTPFPSSFLYLPSFSNSHAHPLISFQYLCNRFHITPLFHLSLHQPNFLSSSSTVAFFHHSCLLPPHFSPPAVTIPREWKKRSALSQHRFTFLSHSVRPARMQDWWFSGFSNCLESYTVQTRESQKQL